MAGIDTATRGTEYLDAFVSRRTSYIGQEVGALPMQTSTVTSESTATITPVFAATNTPTIMPTILMTSTPPPGTVSTFFPIGTGGSDVIPHHVVRTNAYFLYLIANQQSSAVLRMYRTTSAGLPNNSSAVAVPIQITETSNIMDNPFDTTTNAYRTAITLASDEGTIGSDLYVGTSGVTGIV